MRTYKTILELNISHDFYPDNKLSSGDLDILPTFETQQLIRNYRMIFKNKDNNNYKLIYEFDKTEQKCLPSIPIEKELKFSFIIKQQNPLFFNFTQIPFIKMGHQILYFSNKIQNTKHKEKLHKEKYVSEAELKYFFPKAMFEVIENLKNSFTIVNTDNQNVVTQSNINNEKKTYTQLQQLQNGYYRISQSKKNISEFITYNQDITGIIGYIDIFIGQKQCHELISNENNNLKQTIEFQSRTMYWQYVIVEKYGNISHIKIIDEQDKIKFEETDEKQRGLDANHKIFISESKIKIKKNNEQTFKLISNGSGTNFDKTIFEKLPYPMIKNVAQTNYYQNEITYKTFVYV